MKKRMLLAVVVMLAAAGFVQAQDGELHGYIDLTYQSKYVWRGIDVFNDKSAFQPTVDLDLYGTGFGVNAQGHMANSGEAGPPLPDGGDLGMVNSERWDITLYYQQRLFGDAPYAINHRLGWVNYTYPELDSRDLDLQELHSIFSFPNLLPVEGLVPTYVLVKLWPNSTNSWLGSPTHALAARGTASGWAHIFMLDYGIPMPSMLPSQPEQVLKLHAEAVYNDGVHPAGANVDQDWSNAVFGACTDIDLGNNMTLTPGVYHQVTMDKSINGDKDETWATLGLKYKF